ncbi:MAG: GIY-YIG nuclease family protein [Elusimicrobia bacterium]|nr:GIY-YIG nuclease family protein [Elusimicrobiota bacterium]
MTKTGTKNAARDRRRFFVYVLRCGDGTLYTGITTCLERRLAEHNSGRGAKYTRAHGQAAIAYSERKCGVSSALRREAAIKKLSRAQKLALISSKSGKTA